MIIYEYVRVPSCLTCKDECKSIDIALQMASEHLQFHEACPIKLYNEQKEIIMNSDKIRSEIKTKFGIEWKY